MHRARTLYTGAFFRRALAVAEATCDESWVLSARHGLVALDRELVTYDEQLSGRRTERAIWGGGVLTSLVNSYRNLPLHLVFLAGAPYVEGVTGYDQRSDVWVSFNAQHLQRLAWTWEAPLRGLARPARWSWFASQARTAAAPPGGGS